MGFPCGSAGKESACNAGDLGSILGLGRSPGEGKGYPLQYSGLENPVDCIIHGGKKNQTWLSDFHFHLPVYWGDPLSTIGSEYFYENISTPSVIELFLLSILYLGIVGWGFPDGWAVNNPPAIQVMQVRSLGQEDPMAKEMSTHSSILSCEISWTEEPGRLKSMGSQDNVVKAPDEQEKDSAILYMYPFSSNPFKPEKMK